MEKMPADKFGEEVIITSDFERQFSEKKNMNLAGGIAEVVDIKPESVKDETPVIFIPGWVQTSEVYKPAIQQLVTEGRRTLSLSHPRVAGNMERTAPQELLEKYPAEVLRRALNITDLIDQKGLDVIDVIAHSEGAIDAVVAACIHSEKFKNIVLFAPAGLIGEDTFFRLFKGFIDQVKMGRPESASDIKITETEKKVVAASLQESLKSLVKNPLRGVREAVEISGTEIHELLRHLHEKGISIVVMATIDDKIFPMDKMQETVKADMLDGFLSLAGGHGAIGEHPELYIKIAEDMLTKLEEKKEKREKESETLRQ